MGGEESRIGIITRPDHEVFGPVAERLRDRGHAVTFIEPGTEVSPDHLDALDLLVNKKIRWESIRALEYAHRNGIATWNGYLPTTIFVNRLSQLAALSAVGFRTPETHVEPPAGPYVGKAFLDIQNEPSLNESGDFYQPLLETDHVDRKCYAVDDGRTIQTAVVEFRSKLYGDREYLGSGSIARSTEDRIGRLLRFTGARGLGVDFVDVDGRPYAIDVNPATSFRRTGLESAIADSIAAASPR